MLYRVYLAWTGFELIYESFVDEYIIQWEQCLLTSSMVKYCSLDINQMHGNVSKSAVGPSFQTEPKSGGGKFL
jgi:hypothetical protein